MLKSEWDTECRYALEAGKTYYLAVRNDTGADCSVTFDRLPPVKLREGTAELTSAGTLELRFTAEGPAGTRLAAAAYDAEGRMLDAALAVLATEAEEVKLELDTRGEASVTWKLTAVNSDFDPLMRAVSSF